MNRIFVPTATTSDWQRLLASPEKHWKLGRSAMTAAACWEAAEGELPPEVFSVLYATDESNLRELRLLAALPEWKVPLPGGNQSTATDVLALTRNECGLTVIAVEAKAGEDFGPTLASKQAEPSDGQAERTAFLLKELHLDMALDGAIRYQLLHRTVAALLTAREFHAASAVMLERIS